MQDESCESCRDTFSFARRWGQHGTANGMEANKERHEKPLEITDPSVAFSFSHKSSNIPTFPKQMAKSYPKFCRFLRNSLRSIAVSAQNVNVAGEGAARKVEGPVNLRKTVKRLTTAINVICWREESKKLASGFI